MPDWGKFAGDLYDGAGNLVDKGKEIVGEGIDKGTDVLGSGLEKVGADEWADKVEDWGDETASLLGAGVGEQQLGQSEEANELIHGRPEKIAAAVKNLRDFQRAFDLVGSGMKKLDSGHWKGMAADTFREKFQTLPTDWVRAAAAFEDAAAALETYAQTVTSAQAKAGEAIALYKEGKQDYETAVAVFREKAEAYNAVRNTDHPLPHPGKFSDPGLVKRQQARETLQRARRARDEAAEAAKSLITAAMAHAPKEPKGLDRAKQEFYDYGVGQGIELAHFGSGVVKGTAGLVNFVRSAYPLDPYNITHPAEYYKGVSTTLAGLVSSAANPDRTLKNAWDAAKGDPSEFFGCLVPELVGTKGGGLIKGGLRAGMKDLLERPKGKNRQGYEKAPDSNAKPCSKVKCAGDPVDIATGRMLLSQTDIALPGSLPLVFERAFLIVTSINCLTVIIVTYKSSKDFNKTLEITEIFQKILTTFLLILTNSDLMSLTAAVLKAFPLMTLILHHQMNCTELKCLRQSQNIGFCPHKLLLCILQCFLNGSPCLKPHTSCKSWLLCTADVDG